MANVIRQDVIEVSVNAKADVLTKLNSEMEKLKSTAAGAVGGGIDKLTSGFDKMKQSAGKSGDSIDELKDSIGGVGKESGLDDAANDADGLKDSLDDVKTSMNGTEKSAKKSHTSLKAFAKVSLVTLGTGLKGILTKLTQIAKKAGGAAYNGLKRMASVSFKALTVGMTAAVGAIGAIVAKSVSAYADYEQLIGGVETLFKGSAGIVEKNADNAFKTAGLSANEYMETVTSFSASLLQSLGGDTEKAASYADMAITDMADNANKMGTSMGSIQDAYQGFAKQNYTINYLMSAA